MVPDPNEVSTPEELAAALRGLTGGRSYTELDRSARDYGGLKSSTLSEAFNKGRPSEETLERLLRACNVPQEARGAWRHARERALTATPPIGGITRVAQADARLLGVHSPIDVPGATGDLPSYLPRDADDGVRGVRAVVKRAAERGGLVLLVGGSSVGKTRSAYEAIRELMPEWWVLHPANIRQMEQVAEAVAAPIKLVIWLDELQKYLAGPTGLGAGTVRALQRPGVVMVATMWPEWYRLYTKQPTSGADFVDPFETAREVLKLADVIHLDSRLSLSELERARTLATGGDRYWKAALESNDYGPIQVIAAAPHLVAHWKGGGSYSAAVLNAAIDATRLGVRSPLSANLLRAAAAGYCDPRERAAAPADWFEAALIYATQELQGAVAALAPVADSNVMGQIAGYVVADYLQQYAGDARYSEAVPGTTWQALCDYLDRPEDQGSVGQRAYDEGLYRYAEPLLRQAADAGIRYAAFTLVQLLDKLGRDDELQVRADAGDENAAKRLVHVLARLGREEELCARISAGDHYAADYLAQLLSQGRPFMRHRIKAMRLMRGLRQAELAHPELTDSYMSLIESGKRLASDSVVELLARKLDCSATYLMNGIAGECLEDLGNELGIMERSKTNVQSKHTFPFHMGMADSTRGPLE